MAGRLGEAQYQMARAHAKRSSQSVSGRLQPQIDALTRELSETSTRESENAALRALTQECLELRAKLNRVNEAVAS